MGRPSEFTQEIADEICRRIANGESLRRICQDDFLPSEKTVYRWREADADFDSRCARAREAQADLKFDQMWDIADAATPENVHVAKLKVGTLQWQASKLAPKKYGEKQQVDVNLTTQERAIDELE